MSSAVHSRHARMVRDMKRMPEQGGCVSGIPDGWVPGDDDDPRLIGEIERRSDQIIEDRDCTPELFDRACRSKSACDALHEFMSVPATDSWSWRRSQRLQTAIMDIAAAMAREELTR